MFGFNDSELSLNCAAFDASCLVQESLLRWLSSTVGKFFEESVSNFTVSDSTVDLAISGSDQWLAWSLVIMLGCLIAALGMGMVTQKWGLLLRSLVSSAISLPLLFLTLTSVKTGLGAVDEFSAGLIKGVTGDFFVTLFGVEGASGNGDTIFVNRLSTALSTSSPGVLLVLMLLIGLGAVFMMVALAFRQLGIVLLIAFAPLAFSILPLSSVWLQRWFNALLALILAKPLMFGSLAVISKVFQEPTGDNFVSSFLTFGVGCLVVAFMPMMAFSFFNFIGSSGSDGLGSAAAVQFRNSGSRFMNSSVNRIRAVNRGGGSAVVRGVPGGVKSVAGKSGKAGGVAKAADAGKSAAAGYKPAPQVKAAPVKPKGGK